MSMIGNFRRVSTEELAELRANPAGIMDVLYPEERGAAPIDTNDHLDIDKAWHGLHYLLTGTADEAPTPLGFILGGQAIGDVDVGYGPARGFDAGQVEAIGTALAPITREVLVDRFAPEEMTRLEIYPAIWARALEGGDSLGYLLDHFDSLKEFITFTAKAGAAMIVFLN